MRGDTAIKLLLLAIAVAFPLMVSGMRSATYLEHIAVQIMLYGMLAMAWDFLFLAGMFSFGHAAFFGIGGYCAGMLVVHAGFTYGEVPLLAGMAVATIAASAVGFLSARVGSVAVFLVTFACAEAIYLVVISNPFGLTNGDNGLLNVVPQTLLGLNIRNKVVFYYVALAALVCSYLVLARLAAGHFGLVLLAIRENPQRVRFAGYAIERYITVAFAISGSVTGLAGALSAFHERIAAPESLAWTTSGEAVLYATLGGIGTLIGPILGTAVVIVMREILSDFLTSWLIFVGLAYLLIIFFLPSGLYSILFRRTQTSKAKSLSNPVEQP